MQIHTAYGLTLHSELALPGLTEADGSADVTVSTGRIDEEPTPVDLEGHGFWAGPGEACHFVENVGAFLVRGGREIIVDAAPDADPTRVRESILGPALALVLHQRGYLVLHSSAVEVEDGAIAFVGGPGWGKSKLADVMHERGHAILADDLTAVDLSPEVPVVLPGLPQQSAVRGPAPLRRIYLLAAGPAANLERIRPGEAILELIRHWYGARFGDQLLAVGNTAAEHLQQCGNLASTVPARRLSRPRLSWSAEHLANLVEADLGTD